jgi:hypothetical protein
MLWNLIVDHIPIWVYVVVGGLGIGAAFYFFSPILIPIWNLMPTWIKLVLGGATATFLAYMGGRYKGRADADEETRRQNDEALKKRQKVDANVAQMDEKTVDKRLDRWMRD